MQVKVHFRITRDRAGLPADFSAARRIAATDGQSIEEIARAELYGLLSRLWLAPPDATLLDRFRVATTEAPE